MAEVPQPRFELGDDGCGDRLVDAERVRHRPVERLGPEITARRVVDEVHRDPEPLVRRARTPPVSVMAAAGALAAGVRVAVVRRRRQHAQRARPREARG